MSNVLDFITSNNPTRDKEIFINGDGESSVISYKDDGNLVIIGEGSSRFRPIHCSELNDKLIKRGYNLVGTRFIRRDESGSLTSELWYDITTPSNVIPVVNTKSLYLNENNEEVAIENSIKICGSDFSNTEIQDEFNSIFGEMNAMNEIQFYSSSMSTVNLINDVVELDLIRPDSDSYTSVLNLSDLTYYNAKPGISCVLNITVEYSKSGKIYTQDFIIPAFHYNKSDDNTPILNISNYISSINGDIQIEYIDKTLRLNPLNSEIDECIIYKCTATYGNL